jgi:TetR/AcrR family transcriptional regulator
MLKKLTEEKQAEILETGIAEFAERGLDGASMNGIAKKAGISVGVLYKYYADKDAFFLACLRRSLSVLDSVLQAQIDSGDKPLVRAEKLIRAVQTTSREHPVYVKLYHELTCSSGGRYASMLAREIEGASAKLYTALLADAKEQGSVRSDIDPQYFAFFFDSLLMMLQFSCGCDYYQERLRLYCGEDANAQDERMARQLLLFLESAFTFDSSQISHRPQKGEKTL